MAITRAGTISAPAVLSDVTLTKPSGMVGSTAVGYGEFLGLLSDRTTMLLQAEGNHTHRIGVSTDGVNIVWGRAFETSAYKIAGFVETPEGEILISTVQKSGTRAIPGKVWRSTGWNKATADATSWAVVLTTPGWAVGYDGRWGFNERSVIRSGARAGTMIFAEYATKVSEAVADGRSPDQSAIRVVMTKDDGRTYAEIFNLRDQYPAGLVAQLHTHGAVVDNYDQRVLVPTGDAGFSDGGRSVTYYCDFENLDAPVWKPIPDLTGGNPRGIQITTVVPLASEIVCLSDNEIGAIKVIPRAGYRVYGAPADVVNLRAGIIGANAYTNPTDPSAPVFFTEQVISASPTYYPTAQVLRNGVFEEAYRSPTALTNGRGIVNMCGPTVAGKVYANIQLAGTTQLLTGTYNAA